MGLTSSLSNAISGLTAAARATDVISSNIANSMTEGHARRELMLSPRSYGGTGGVRIDGVTRVVDQAVLRDRRLADSAMTNASVQSGFYTNLEKIIGDPEDGASLSGRIARLDTALIEAASRPDSEARLASVLGAAKDLAEAVNTVSRSLSTARTDADRAISRDVDFVNTSLGQLAQLNATILSQTSSGRDASALLDQRQALIDRIGAVIPVVELPRDNNQAALMTKGGAILLDGGRPAKIEFDARTVVTPDMTIANGLLSGLKINGMSIPTTTGGILDGGTLGANFQLRDQLATGAQAQLDALSRDLISRFSDPATDATLPPGAPGLFTDAGLALDPLNETGLASRISVNGLADPAAGGALWRLRAGLHAAGPGDAGQTTGLIALKDALSRPQTPASGTFLGAARSFAGLTADMQSQVSADRLRTESATSYAAAQKQALTDLHLAQGVDTDDEMQRLLVVERSYSANARVIQTIDQMLDELLRL